MRKARQPEGEVDPRVAEARPVPVDEHGAPVGNADVVAAHIEMQERLARRRRSAPIAASSSGSAASSHSAEQSPSERNGAGSASTSARCGGRRSVSGGTPSGGGAACSSSSAWQTRSTSPARQGGGQCAPLRSSSTQHRQLAVVVPAEQAREVVGLEGRVDPVLVAQEAGRRLVDRELRERSSPVRELDEPPLHERVAATGEPDERPGAEPRR